jgi:hypothetical protein
MEEEGRRGALGIGTGGEIIDQFNNQPRGG